MEFKIKDKTARSMKYNATFLEKIQKIYSPCLVSRSVVHLAYFVVFGRCLSQLSIDEVVYTEKAAKSVVISDGSRGNER